MTTLKDAPLWLQRLLLIVWGPFLFLLVMAFAFASAVGEFVYDMKRAVRDIRDIESSG